jgi:hypothetical protein
VRAQAAADLRAAAEVLRRDGWTQGAYHTLAGCHCAEGALALTVGQHVYDEGLPDAPVTYLDVNWWAVNTESAWLRRDAAEDALRHHVGPDIVEWNDTPDRTADEVIAALEAAADAAEAEL